MMWEPITVPLRRMSCPFAFSGKSTCASPVTTSGYTNPSNTVVTSVMNTEIRRFFFIVIPYSGHPNSGDDHVDQLDTDERDDNSAHSIDQQVVAQQCGCAHGTVLNTP